MKIKIRGNKLKYYTFSTPKLPSRDNTDTDQAKMYIIAEKLIKIERREKR